MTELSEPRQVERGKKYVELHPQHLLALLTNRGVLQVTGLPDDARIEFGEWDMRANRLRLLVSSCSFPTTVEAGQYLTQVPLSIETNYGAEAVLQMIRELAGKLDAGNARADAALATGWRERSEGNDN